MDQDDIRRVLEDVASGKETVDDAVLKLRMEPFEDLGYAKIDHHRGVRQGVTEVIFGAGKTPEQIAGIAGRMLEHGEKCIIITRISRETADFVAGSVPLTYDPTSRIALAGKLPEKHDIGKITVITAGTSDIPVAEEAVITAEALGNNVVRVYDAGVSGIHRLLAHQEDIMTSKAIMLSPAWRAPSPASSAGWRTVRSSPFRPASDTERRSEASRPCWRCSTPAPAGSAS